MPQDVLQSHDVPAVHDEVTSERMAQHVAGLPSRKLDRRGQQHDTEHPKAVGERSVSLPMLANFFGQLIQDRNRANTLRLGIGEDHLVALQPIQVSA